MVKIVNAVGSGSFDREFDLSVVAEDLGSLAEFDEEKYPGMYVRLALEETLNDAVYGLYGFSDEHREVIEERAETPENVLKAKVRT